MECNFHVSQDKLDSIVRKVNQGQDLFLKEDVVFLIDQLGYWAKKYLEEVKGGAPEIKAVSNLD